VSSHEPLFIKQREEAKERRKQFKSKVNLEKLLKGEIDED